MWSELASGVKSEAFTISGLVAGTTYTYAVQSRNIVGYSVQSTAVSLVAAQGPSTPNTPVTYIDEVQNRVYIQWDEPSSNGSPITGYVVKIRSSDLVTFYEDTASCNGLQTSIITTRICSLTVQKLLESPFDLTVGTSVFATIKSLNAMGESGFSTAGNCAILKLSVPPDAPVNLKRVDEFTLSGQASISWSDCESNGG